MAGAGGAPEQPESGGLKHPIVFQCAECRRLVGDSLSIIAADEELRTLTLQGEFAHDTAWMVQLCTTTWKSPEEIQPLCQPCLLLGIKPSRSRLLHRLIGR
jgi:hypothetical protein